MSRRCSARRARWVGLVVCATTVACAGSAGRGRESGSTQSGAPGAPRGLSCADPLPLPLGRSVLGSTRGGGQQLSAVCAPSDSPERVYRLGVTGRSELQVVLGADFDAALSVRRSCAPGRSEIACNDDYPRGESSQSQLSTVLDAGEYFVVVDGADGNAGTYELFASLRPVGSVAAACQGANSLVPGVTARGSTRGRGDLFHASCGRGAQAGERIYRFSVQQPSRLRALQQSDYDGVLHLRTVCTDATSELACNDDFRGPNRSLLTARVEPGTYYLFSDGLSPLQEGTHSLRAELHPIDTEPSDPAGSLAASCQAARALPLNPGSVELDTFSLASLQAASCGGAQAPEAIYAFEILERSRVWVRMAEAEFSAVLSLRRQCEEPSSEIACEEQGRVDRPPLPGQRPPHGLNLLVDPGTYFLFVDGAGAFDFGAAQVTLDVEPEPPLRALCGEASWLHDGQVIEGETRAGPDRFRATCGGEARAPEDLYRLRVESTSRLRLQLESGYDAVLHVRRDCTDVRTELGCNDDDANERLARVDLTLPPGEYLVAVDGFGPEDVGPYRLRVSLGPPQPPQARD